ncbi:hypothetical protein [Microtetraspora malaysiensis]|uniref:hypothetical protein n=1 Tax=Microtetraspora malaysiensis TaxID=161358 RepID=UPI00082AFB04|nr:hypothetical protein [Microtetraspora malaysiensis]
MSVATSHWVRSQSATLDSLYPADAWDLPVNAALPAPRLPAPPEEQCNLTGYRDHYQRFILREFPVPGHVERIVAIDKAFPHSLYDLMLMVGRDDELRTDVSNTPDAVLAALLHAARGFADFTADAAVQRAFGLAGSQLGIAWNHDPTRDRDNGQWWDKRLHLHLNCWTADVRATVQPVRLVEISDTATRRSLVDPAAHLAHRVMLDALRGTPLPAGCDLLEPDLRRDAAWGLPIGLKLRLPGWQFVTTAQCRALLRSLHATGTAGYQALLTAFTGSRDAPAPWTRPHLLPPAEVERNIGALPWLSAASRSDLLRLRHVLRDVTDREMRLLADRPWIANRCLTLGGLSYNIAFFAPQTVDQPGDGLYLVMQFKLVSYIGSSPSIGGAVASIIDRSGGPIMTAADRVSRAAFQRAYLNTLTALDTAA